VSEPTGRGRHLDLSARSCRHDTSRASHVDVRDGDVRLVVEARTIERQLKGMVRESHGSSRDGADSVAPGAACWALHGALCNARSSSTQSACRRARAQSFASAC
jgi:hypothetical protein